MFLDTFQLEFLTAKDDDLLHPPIVRVKLASFSLDGNSSTPIITPNCIGRQEFDEQIEKMIAELRHVQEQGHRKYDAEDCRMAKK